MQGVVVQLGGQVTAVCGLNTGSSTLGTFLSILWVRFQMIFMFRNKKAAAERKWETGMQGGRGRGRGVCGVMRRLLLCVMTVCERWPETGTCGICVTVYTRRQQGTARHDYIGIIGLTAGGCRRLRAGLAALKAKQAKEKEAREAKKVAESHEGEFYHGIDGVAAWAHT